jgi:toluene monooxygenase system ferredoxin subunit
MQKQRICSASDVPDNGMKSYDIEGMKILVVNAGECFHAYQGLCPHQDVCLDEGYFDGQLLTCHQHLWQWDIRTGEAVGLAEAPLEKYEVEVSEGEIFVLQSSALKAVDMLKDVSAASLERLEALARREQLSAGAVIYEVDDPADDLYVLESGRVEFTIGRDDRTRLAGFMLRKGEVFGWAALLEQHPRRIARAVCHEDSVLLRLNGEAMLDALEADPTSGLMVMRRLATLVARHTTGPQNS